MKEFVKMVLFDVLKQLVYHNPCNMPVVLPSLYSVSYRHCSTAKFECSFIIAWNAIKFSKRFYLVYSCICIHIEDQVH